MKKTKRDLLLAAAKTLFWKHGFQRVSVEEVCEKAAVSKMTFYRFFANKIELAKAVLDQVMEEGAEQFRAVMHGDDPPELKFRKMLLQKQEGTNDISREFLADFYSNREPELRAYVDAKVQESWQRIVADFKTAQQLGILRSDIKPEFILIFSNKLTDLVNDPALLSLYDKPQDLIMELTNLMIYGLTPHK